MKTKNNFYTSLIILAILTLSFTLNTRAQNYLLNFVATGTATTLDSIKIENITQGTSLTILGSDILHLTSTSGISNLNLIKENIKVNPNPMQGYAELSFFAKNTGNVQLSLNDALGKNVYLFNQNLSFGNQTYQISGLTQGMYFINIKGDNYSYTVKLLSQNTNKSDLKINHIENNIQSDINYESKSIQSTIDWQYNTGESLSYTGYSNNCYNTLTNVPTISNTITFTFVAASYPTLTTTAVTAITGTTASTGGEVTADGGCLVTLKGLCYNTVVNPTIANSIIVGGNGLGSFTTNLTGLTPLTPYYIRTFATTSAGTFYGNQRTFTTTALLPTLTTTATLNITCTSAISGGNITNTGGAAVTARGICWSTSANPIVTGNHTTNGTGTGSFNGSLTGLIPSTTYYVRAYATNSAGTAYGNEFSFTTNDLAYGESYQGGWIFYILQPGDIGYDVNVVHGLIAAIGDQSAGIEWKTNTYITTGAIETAIGTGNANTNVIVATQGVGLAAGLCYSLSSNGYSDWYLPSRDELNKLYEAKVQGAVGFQDQNYWSSSEIDNSNAWRQAFNDGTQTNMAKNIIARVRAIRSF